MTLQQVIDTLSKAQWKEQQVQCINLYAGGPEDVEIIYMAPKENIQVNESEKVETKSEAKEEPKTGSKETDEPKLETKGENK